ncbi:MAG: hypothetical protein WAN04_01180 [Candidatus Udaeobacter sp.]
MKTKIISKLLLSLGLVFVLGSAITQVRGDTEATSPAGQLPAVTIHSTDNVTRGQTGSFVLDMRQSAPSENAYLAFRPYVNFSVSGTAIPGVDYVALVSPVQLGPDGYGVILVKTLPDRRGPTSSQACSVVVTMEAGAGYAVGAPSSATMWIKPCSTSAIPCN